MERFEFGLSVAFEGPAAAGVLVLRIVEACERTEAATDFGLTEGVMLLAVLFLLDAVVSDALDVRDTRDACDAWEGVRDFCETWDGLRDDACDGAPDASRGVREVVVDADADAPGPAGPLALIPDARDVVDVTDLIELADEANGSRKPVPDLAMFLLSTLARRDVMLAVSPSPSGFPEVELMVGRNPVRVGGPFVGPNGCEGRIRSSRGTSSS